MSDQWETSFCDVGYYHMWRLRRKNERGWNDGFHINTKAEAEGLCELLNKLERELTEAREQRDRAQSKIENQAERIKCLEGATNHATGTPLSKMREQRDRLAEEIENLKASGIHTCHDQCKRPMCVMRRERDRLQNELNELKEDRDAWKSEALIMDARLRGVKHPNDNGIFSPDEVIPKLERELAETGEERDRLAEAMDRIAVLYESKEMTGTVDQRIADAYDMRCMARAALAAVKGGSDD